MHEYWDALDTPGLKEKGEEERHRERERERNPTGFFFLLFHCKPCIKRRVHAQLHHPRLARWRRPRMSFASRHHQLILALRHHCILSKYEKIKMSAEIDCPLLPAIAHSLCFPHASASRIYCQPHSTIGSSVSPRRRRRVGSRPGIQASLSTR